MPSTPLSRPHHAAKPRYKYHRRHTVHYYLVIASVFASACVCVLNFIGYKTGSIQLAEVCFASIVLANALISTAFFWGFFMVMNGHIPTRRIKVLLPHATVGVLSPLLYTLNISINLDGLGAQSVSGLSLACSVGCLGLLAVQWMMGRAIVKPEPIRIMVPTVPDAISAEKRHGSNQPARVTVKWRREIHEEKDS